MHFSLKIGLGTNSANSQIQTKNDALDQYNRQTSPIGIKTVTASNPAVVAWPKELTFSLDQRVAGTRYDRKEKDRIDESTKMSGEEKDAARRKLRSLRHEFIDRLQFAHQSIYGDDPARQRLVHFWLNHFTIGGGSPANFMIGHVIQEVIGKGLQGDFTRLAYDIIRHPGMLTYLDNVYSVGEKSQRGRNARGKFQVGLNDNLAREMMELYTTSPSIGYSEEDIREAAKVLSGWGDIFDNPKTVQNFKDARIKDFHEAFFKDKEEPGKKTILGKVYRSGKGALEELVTDLASSEHAARFLCRKLCVHFIEDMPSQSDFEFVLSAWLDTNGHLPTVHSALLERACASTKPKMQWPMTWLFTVLRSSKAHVVQGFDDLHKEVMGFRAEYRIRTLLEEIGQDFWSRRQPDGFSIYGPDWVSPEHFERRMRLAAMIHDHGRPARKADELMDIFDVSQATRNLVNKGKTSQHRFILLTCSPEFLGA